MEQLKLYVWDEFCPIWSSGLAFAVASNEEEAKLAVVTKLAEVENERSYYKFTVEEIMGQMTWGPIKVFHIDEFPAFGKRGTGL